MCAATAARKLREETDFELGNRKTKQIDMMSEKIKIKNNRKIENISENKTETLIESETEPPSDIETKQQQGEIDSDNEESEADVEKVTSGVDSSLDSSNEDESDIGGSDDVAEISDDEKFAPSDKETADDVTMNKKDFEKDEVVEETNEDQDKDHPTITDKHAGSQTSLVKEEVEIESDISKEKEGGPTDDKSVVFVEIDKDSNGVTEPIEGHGDEVIEIIDNSDGEGSNTEPVGDSKEKASMNDIESSVDFGNNTESAEDTDEDAAGFSVTIDEGIEIEELQSSDKEIEVIATTDDDKNDEEMVTVKDEEKVIHSTGGGETSEDGAVVADSTEESEEGEEVEPSESENVVNENTDEVEDGDEIINIEGKTEGAGTTENGENDEEVDPSKDESEAISPEEVKDAEERGTSNDVGSSGDLKVKSEAEDDLDEEIQTGLGDKNEDNKEAQLALGDGEDLKLGESDGADDDKADVKDVKEIEISKNATEVLDGEISDEGTSEVEDSEAKVEDEDQENLESELFGGKEEGDTTGARDSKDDLEDQNEYGSETAVPTNVQTELDGDDNFEDIYDDQWLNNDEDDSYEQDTKVDDISWDELNSNNIGFETEQTNENIIDGSFDDDNWFDDDSSSLAGPFMFALVVAAGLFLFWKKRSNHDSTKVGYRPVPRGARMKSHTK